MIENLDFPAQTASIFFFDEESELILKRMPPGRKTTSNGRMVIYQLQNL